jgi:hypothetical protein
LLPGNAFCGLPSFAEYRAVPDTAEQETRSGRYDDGPEINLLHVFPLVSSVIKTTKDGLTTFATTG